MQKLIRRAVRAAFEALEFRRHLSTVNVADFGALPNDGVDDAPAIRRALSASRGGDTILFSGGAFDLNGEMTLPENRSYIGQKGAILEGDGADGHLIKLQGDNITIRGLTFEGGGVFIENPAKGMNSGITLDNNTFIMQTGGRHKSGITFTSGLEDSKITNNYFTGYNGGFAIYGYNYQGLTIANNEIINTAAGMHIDAFGNSGNLLVEQNYISGAKGMGMEFQSSAKNVVFQDNWYENPSFTSISGSSSGNTMAYSLILDKSSNITIRRNVAIMPLKGTTGKDYTRIAFEVGGDNVLVEDNYSYGGNHVLAMNDGVGTASVTVRNNKFMKYAQGIGNTFASSNRTLKQSNNGANVDLTWELDRGKPGRNRRLGEERKPATPIDEPSEPTESGKPRYSLEDFTFLSDIDWKSANSSWGPVERDLSNGRTGEEDGWLLRLDNKRYTKGLGVAADSVITYDLDGKFSKFFSDIGVDEYAESAGSMTFEVWVDGKLAYDSGIMTGETFHKGITVNVEGAKTLNLVTTDGGDGHKSDHGNWAAARLVK